MTMQDYIKGERFSELADNRKVFYCSTHSLPNFLQNVPDDPFVLITHNSDHKIHESYKIPDNLIHWFAQNVDKVDPRIESIPIGLENDKWFRAERKKEKMIVKLTQPRGFHNMVYFNCNIDTNPNERLLPFVLFKDKPWCTAKKGCNGQGFDEYLNDLYNHPFVISPEGNGIDTVRTWECLYMGTIPIEKRNINNQFYTDLPILFVDAWEEITESLLQDEYERIIHTQWNLEKLNFSYWKNKILSYDK